MERMIVITKITNLNLNRGPRAALRERFLAARGRAYLQQNGGTTSYWPFKAKPTPTRRPDKIMYFILLNAFNFLVENFLVGILCNKSWKNPKGHKKPQISLPKMTPKNIIRPIT